MERAAFWIIDGTRYANEATWSALSVKEQMPDLQRVLFTPNMESKKLSEADPFTQIVQLSPRQSKLWYLDYLWYLGEALPQLPEQVVELDGDVFFVAPVPEMFEMLNAFDIAMAFAPGHRTAPNPHNIPIAYSEYNTGVNVQRNVPAVYSLWQAVYKELASHQAEYGDNDQSPLRTVLWNGDADVCVGTLTSEYNCRFPFGVMVADEVKVLHGHLRDDVLDKAAMYKTIAQVINSAKGVPTDVGTTMRVWSPYL